MYKGGDSSSILTFNQIFKFRNKENIKITFLKILKVATISFQRDMRKHLTLRNIQP